MLELCHMKAGWVVRELPSLQHKQCIKEIKEAIRWFEIAKIMLGCFIRMNYFKLGENESWQFKYKHAVLDCTSGVGINKLNWFLFYECCLVP